MKKIVRISLLFSLLLFSVSCASLKKSKVSEQKVKITTTEGMMIVKLYNETPLHRDNFLKHVKAKVYDGVIFHRVIEDFMIQGGDPGTRSDKQKKKVKKPTPAYTIPAEIITPALYHKKGTLAAARFGDNANPLKSSSAYQFYIVKGKKFSEAELDNMQVNKIQMHQRKSEAAADSTYKFSEKARHDYQSVGGTPHLDGNYTVFGEVISGFDVIDKISAVETGEADKPVKDVRVVKMRRIR